MNVVLIINFSSAVMQDKRKLYDCHTRFFLTAHSDKEDMYTKEKQKFHRITQVGETAI